MTTINRLVATIGLCSAVVLAGCTKPQENAPKTEASATAAPATVEKSAHAASVGEAMEAMAKGYSAAKKSQTLDEFKAGFEGFKTAVDSLTHIEHGTKDAAKIAIFNEGVKQLQTQIKAVDAALAAGSLEKAQAELKPIHETEKTFHKKLGVED